MDRATSTATIVTSDGRAASFPLLSSPFDPRSFIVRFEYVPIENLLYAYTELGDTIIAELPSLSNPAPRFGRPVIYLDQRDWSLLANVLYEPERIRSTVERDAAERLIALARETKIILPMSFAHMAETSRWTNTERRYHLALTVVGLSRGWQMRHPLDIRRHELRQSIAINIKQIPLPPLDVFTLAGCAAQPKSPSRPRYGARAGLPPEVAHAVDALTCISSYFEIMLASEAMAMNPISGWDSENQQFTDWLAEEPRTRSQKRKTVWARFFGDIGPEVVQAAHESGITRSEMALWLTRHFDGDVRAMASLGLFNEVYQDKHLNQRTTWRSNDLIDMMYLTCAAGYADYVVAERSLVSHARQAAKRLQRPIKIYPRISDLMVPLKNAGL
jgi:hypothetical protein